MNGSNSALRFLTTKSVWCFRQVSAVGAKVICIAIKMNPALKLLSLSRNALPDQSKRELYDAWSHREMEDGQAQSGM